MKWLLLSFFAIVLILLAPKGSVVGLLRFFSKVHRICPYCGEEALQETDETFLVERLWKCQSCGADVWQNRWHP